jgi:hypothetical protein
MQAAILTKTRLPSFLEATNDRKMEDRKMQAGKARATDEHR